MELTIDDRTIEAAEGERLLDAARRNGIEIPHFCYHPRLSVAGNCRMCLVKLEGVPKLMPACNVVVAAKMKVHTTAPEVLRARQAVMQFMMVNHPVDCGICDKAGECRLQDYQFAYGQPRSSSNEPKRRKRKLYDLSPRIQLDNERCILCSRCVRFTREVSRTHMLGIVERGGHACVERVAPDSVTDPYSDNVIGLCPTGALLSRDFFYKARVWYLEPVRSVCTGCARGCSVELWRRKKEWRVHALDEGLNRAIYRVTAGENPQVNGSWLCNKGFDLHKAMARERAQPAAGGAPATLEQAIERARELWVQAKRPAVLVSAHASNEELDALADALRRDLAERVTIYTREDCKPAPGEVVEDDLLIKADKNPNSWSVRLRFGTRPLGAAEAQGHDLFLVWGEIESYANLGDARVIHLRAFAHTCERDADVVIPISTTFERSGSFFNFEGTFNGFEQALEKPPQAEHAATVFARLTA